MDPKYIVAIEIGSSKIHGAVAAVQPDGSLSVLASECQRATGCVRYGRVSNVQEVSTHVNNILRKLENHPDIMPRKISEIYVGLGGRSFSSLPATATINYNREIEITAEAIKRLKDEANFGLSTPKPVLEILPRRYFVNNKEVTNIVGTVGTSVRAEFTALLCAQDNRNYLDRIKFESPVIRRRTYLLRPVAVADMVLDYSERQLGCVLVDIGAETTTVMVYKDGSLQFASTLPLGSRNITLDLKTGLSLTEDRAEQVKLTLGNAINERYGQQLSAEQLEVNQYVQARTGEIIANVIHQVEASGYKMSDLPAGFIVVGGGARLRNFNQALTTQAKCKTRMGTATSSINVCQGIDPDRDIDILALLSAAADRNGDSCLVCDEVERPEAQQPAAQTESISNYEVDPRQEADDSADEYPVNSNRPKTKDKKPSFFDRLFGRKNNDRDALMDDDDDDDLMDDDDDELASPHNTYNGQTYNNGRNGQNDAQDDEDDDRPAQTKGSRFNGIKERVARFLEKGDDADLDDRNN